MDLGIHLWLGDSVDRMVRMSTCSMGVVCCDPPYGLEFMGQDWDKLGAAVVHDPSTVGGFQDGSGGNPYSRSRIRYGGKVDEVQKWHQEWLAEAYRILVVGGVAKIFSGTRTYHRLMAAMVRVGFRGIRLEAWSYGSGFPKSLDVSKAIDRHHGRIYTSVEALKQELRVVFDASGKSRKQIDEECGFRACNYLSALGSGKRPDPWFSVLPSQRKWEVMRRVLGIEGTAEQVRLDAFFAEAEREVIGHRRAIPGVAFNSEGPSEVPVTIPATPEADTWEGWGTALKPAWEPVLVGYK